MTFNNNNNNNNGNNNNKTKIEFSIIYKANYISKVHFKDIYLILAIRTTFNTAVKDDLFVSYTFMGSLNGPSMKNYIYIITSTWFM